MWRAVYNQNGKQISDNTIFFETLRREHTPTSKVELLDTDFHEVDGGTIFSADVTNELTNFVSDGMVDVDVTRATRRTSELTLLNPTSEFTPTMKNDDWDGKVYLNRMVRIWRGLYASEQRLYVPCGTFMIDNIDVLVEQNMSLVNLTMSDRWKMLSKSYYGHNKTYEKNTLYVDIIRDMLQAAQIDMTGRFGAVIDGLQERDSADRRTNIKIQFKIGDSRGDKLKELCDRWDIDAYFDPLGVFRTEDRRDAKDKKEIWQFRSSDAHEAEKNGMLVSLRRSFNDDNLYNHVIVVGTGRKKGVVRAAKENNNPASVTNIDRIGDRVLLVESEKINTQAEANRALERAWRLRFQLSESLEAQVISNPALEGDDVIRITEKEKAKVDDTYRIQRFNVPLVSSLQTIQAVNIIRETN